MQVFEEIITVNGLNSLETGATQDGYAHDPRLSATQATREGKTNLSNNHVGF